MGDICGRIRLVEAVVDQAVAIVVPMVAGLHGAGVDVEVPVIAVAGGLVPIAIDVDPSIDHGVAVIIDAVADLDRTGKNQRIGGGAVDARVGTVTVAVLVDVTVTIVVLPVANLHVGGEVARIGVVAVAGERRLPVTVAVALE